MYGWCLRFMIRRSIQRHQAGDVEALLAAYADDVRFVFPGQSSWTADLRGKNAIEPWLRRFHLREDLSEGLRNYVRANRSAVVISPARSATSRSATLRN
jgi:ketosteroid isomerase-like protein